MPTNGRTATRTVVLIRRETNPDDFHGMIVSQGILTSAGGTSSHAALVARGAGIPAVCGADALRIDTKKKAFTVGSDDGQGRRLDHHRRNRRNRLRRGPRARGLRAGRRDQGRQAGEEDPICGGPTSASTGSPRSTAACACERTPIPPTTRPTRGCRGAEGIGLCRTEHMFMGERAELVRKMIFADTEDGGEGSLRRPAPASAQ